LNSFGINSNGNKVVHRILQDLTSLELKTEENNEEMSAFDTPTYELT